MNCFIHPRYFSDRREMLNLIPRGGVIAEVGVFNGDFSAQILEAAQPKELFLIDLWADELVESGDVNGNNVRQVNGRELESQVRARFADDARVRVIRGTSMELAKFPESSFDAVYIDADHEYDAVRSDLRVAFRVLRDSGWLMGHDYGVNPERTTARWTFGVRDATEDFCRDYSQQIEAFAMDGCTSFALRVDKAAIRGRELAVRVKEARTFMMRRARDFAVGTRRLLRLRGSHRPRV